MATYALAEKAVVLRPEDDVAVAKAELMAGTVLDDGGHRIEVRQHIKPGHKVARRTSASANWARTPTRSGWMFGRWSSTRPRRCERSTASSASQFVKDRFRAVQKDYPSIDGVHAVTHKRSKSELSGVGEEEFAPWIIGPVM